jgi:hypothetical protein
MLCCVTTGKTGTRSVYIQEVPGSLAPAFNNLDKFSGVYFPFLNFRQSARKLTWSTVNGCGIHVIANGTDIFTTLFVKFRNFFKNVFPFLKKSFSISPHVSAYVSIMKC